MASDASTSGRMSIKEQTPPEEETLAAPPHFSVELFDVYPQLPSTMNAVFAMVILGAMAAASTAALPTATGTKQWSPEQFQSNYRRDVGVGNVNFGTGSFNPNVNVNNTGYPSVNVPSSLSSPVNPPSSINSPVNPPSCCYPLANEPSCCNPPVNVHISGHFPVNVPGSGYPPVNVLSSDYHPGGYSSANVFGLPLGGVYLFTYY
ncbi:uncharacterized protein LOC124545934 [Schistocerca americana]|uniref:uncharacterized protein LOC124545934 n=1 Tax=Schistocerca americana TaxID=7009 RepID=UPI001F4FF747|nr:uncharacterized protein LOC124545934 [Schistocerca americana]